MIKRFDLENVNIARAIMRQLPKGAYIMRIQGANIVENENGAYIKVAMDIEEGEYKGYYNDAYKNSILENKNWQCNLILGLPREDESERNEWLKVRFKTFVVALEQSNPGYHFNWDESSFRGLLIGGLFANKEFRKRDGSIGMATNLERVCSVEDVRNGHYSLPKDRTLESGHASAMNIPTVLQNIPTAQTPSAVTQGIPNMMQPTQGTFQSYAFPQADINLPFV
jgi:hypothetical protein